MKIGIVTFQNAENYGAALQCRALYTYLAEYGNNVEIIDYKNSVIENSYKIFPKLRKNLFKFALSFIYALKNYKKLKNRSKKFRTFLKGIKISLPMTYDEICKADFDHDLIIAGSDQIWNPNITNGFDKVYFLNIGGNFRKAGYAISMGDITYPQFSAKEFSDNIKRFDYLSFREPDAADFINKKTGKNFPQVLDPTLLLTREQWDKIIGNIKLNIPDKYVFVYFVVDGQSSQEIIKIADRLSKQNSIPIVYLKMNRKIRDPFKNRVITVIDAGPREFLYFIKNASFVVTSSFHGTALSCIYQKDLNVVIPDQKGSRVAAIAEMFHLNDRVFDSYEDFCNRINESKKTIETETEEYRKTFKRSVDYLKQITE